MSIRLTQNINDIKKLWHASKRLEAEKNNYYRASLFKRQLLLSLVIPVCKSKVMSTIKTLLAKDWREYQEFPILLV